MLRWVSSTLVPPEEARVISAIGVDHIGIILVGNGEFP
jgi:hypothetical protein